MYIHCYTFSGNILKIILCILSLKSSLLRFYRKWKLFYCTYKWDQSIENAPIYIVNAEATEVMHFYSMVLFPSYFGKQYNNSGEWFFS